MSMEKYSYTVKPSIHLQHRGSENVGKQIIKESAAVGIVVDEKGKKNKGKQKRGD